MKEDTLDTLICSTVRDVAKECLYDRGIGNYYSSDVFEEVLIRLYAKTSGLSREQAEERLMDELDAAEREYEDDPRYEDMEQSHEDW